MALAIIILGFVLDRVTKLLAVQYLKDVDNITVIQNFFAFQYAENRGAAFGIMQGKQSLLGIITLVVIIGMLYYLFKYKPESRLLKISLSLIIGGALGNLYDRFSYNFVVDFVLLHYKDVYYWPNFNVADMLVVVGTLLMSLYIVKDVKE